MRKSSCCKRIKRFYLLYSYPSISNLRNIKTNKHMQGAAECGSKQAAFIHGLHPGLAIHPENIQTQC